MSCRGISLTRESQQKVIYQGRGAFRLRVRAHDAVKMPAKIFAHQKTLVDPDTGEQADEFCFVCSPFDCTFYPADSPDDSQFPQFFRKDVIDILLASQDMALDAWNVIEEQVCELVDAYDRLDMLSAPETTRCGCDLDTDDTTADSSSEGSASESRSASP